MQHIEIVTSQCTSCIVLLLLISVHTMQCSKDRQKQTDHITKKVWELYLNKSCYVSDCCPCTSLYAVLCRLVSYLVDESNLCERVCWMCVIFMLTVAVIIQAWGVYDQLTGHLCHVTCVICSAKCRSQRIQWHLSFVLSLFICIFLHCFVCQYQSSDWLWRPPPKWPILCRVGR